MEQEELITALHQVHQAGITEPEVLIQKVPDLIQPGAEIIRGLKVEFRVGQADRDRDIVDPVPDPEEADSVNNNH